MWYVGTGEEQGNKGWDADGGIACASWQVHRAEGESTECYGRLWTAGRGLMRSQNWIVCGSDDFQLRVYNYNTSEKVTTFEAHPDCKLEPESPLDRR